MLSALPEKEQDSKRQELSRRLVQSKVVSLPIAEAWQAWLASPLKGNPSKETIEGGYRAIWRRFSGWMTGHDGVIQPCRF